MEDLPAVTIISVLAVFLLEIIPHWVSLPVLSSGLIWALFNLWRTWND